MSLETAEHHVSTAIGRSSRGMVFSPTEYLEAALDEIEEYGSDAAAAHIEAALESGVDRGAGRYHMRQAEWHISSLRKLEAQR